MSALSRQRLRLRVNVTTRNIGVEVFTSATPRLLKPGDTQFEVALFADDATDLIDITHLDQLQLDIKRTDPRTGLSVMQKIVSSGDLNFILAYEDWAAGAPDDCHAKFIFTAAETNIELDGDEADYYLVISGLSDDDPALQIPFGNGIIVIEESGAYSDPPAGVVEPLFYTAAQSDARYLLSADVSGKVNRSGDTMTGALTLSGAPTLANHAATKAYVDSTVGSGAFLPLSGGTLSGLLTLSGAPSSNLHAATKLYVDTAVGAKLNLSGGTMTGALTLSGAPSSSLHAATKAYVDTMLPLAGGTMTGALTLSGSPTLTLHAATKGYVDSAIANLINASPSALDTLNELAAALGNDANFATTVTNSLAGKLSLSGGTMSGALTLSGAPITSLHAATKAYADLKLALTGGTLSGAVNFSGTSHVGLTVNRLSSAQITALGASTNGAVVYDTTLEAFRFREANTWKTIGTSGGGGTTWLQSGGVAPDNGDGANGDYNLRDDGTIDFKAAGAWSVLVGPRLPLSGGTVTGAVNFGAGPILFDGWSIQEPTTNILEFIQNSSVWFKMDAVAELFLSNSADIGVASGYGFLVNGIQVVGAQQAANADTTGATLGQLETEVNEIKAALRAHGLIAT